MALTGAAGAAGTGNEDPSGTPEFKNALRCARMGARCVEMMPLNQRQAEGVEALTTLTLLELGSNRLRSLAPLESLTGLRELWLGRNKISSLEHLSRC